jgi:hypothetical protein
MLDVCTTGDTAHIDTMFKFLPHTFNAAMIRARVIAAVKKIDAPMLTRVWQEI